jgi:hypothetical protein
LIVTRVGEGRGAAEVPARQEEETPRQILPLLVREQQLLLLILTQLQVTLTLLLGLQVTLHIPLQVQFKYSTFHFGSDLDPLAVFSVFRTVSGLH